MESNDHTQPPCKACHAHDDLEDKFTDMRSRNYSEHTELKTTLRWMTYIGSALVTGIGLIFLMVWDMHSQKQETENLVGIIQTDIKYIAKEVKDVKIYGRDQRKLNLKQEKIVADVLTECQRKMKIIWKKKEFYE